MSQVDFYVVSAPEAVERLHTACRLADKAWRRGHRVFIQTASGAEASELDRLLWTFRDESFVPHALATGHADASEPILIGDGREPAGDVDVLINLARDVPLCAGRSARIAEVIGANPAERAAGRVRYRQYRERGYPINSHTI